MSITLTAVMALVLMVAASYFEMWIIQAGLKGSLGGRGIFKLIKKKKL